MAVAAFLSFLGRVQLSDAGLSVSAASEKRRQQVFYYFNKIDLSLNLILPKYNFQFYNLIEFEICLTILRVGCCLSRGWAYRCTGFVLVPEMRGAAVALV